MVSITNASRMSTAIISRLRSTRSTHAPMKRPKREGERADGEADRRMGQLEDEQRQREAREGAAEHRDRLSGEELPEVLARMHRGMLSGAVKAPPQGLDEAALSLVVADRWRIDVESISYE